MMEFLLGGVLSDGGHLIWTAPAWQSLAAIIVALLAWLTALLTGRGTVGQRALELLLWGAALAALAAAAAEPV